jgi:hypothetical protein
MTVAELGAMVTDTPVPRRFLRAVRLEKDYCDASALDGYSVTPLVQHLLSHLDEVLRPETTERAWTLTGPYGTGKSACAMFLAHLLAAPADRNGAWKLLAKQNPALADRIRATLRHVGLFPVLVTLRSAPLATCLLEGIARAVEQFPDRGHVHSLIGAIETDLRQGQRDAGVVMRRVEALVEAVCSTERYRGVLLVLDELGRALDYAARYPGEDLALLQELAEYASRSGERLLLLIAILHQAFEQYARHLDVATVREWRKIEGRFRHFAFLEPPEQLVRFAAQAAEALQATSASAWRGHLSSVAQAVAGITHAIGNMAPDEFQDLASRAYPLHPLTLLALAHLFRRFAQNERSLFSYLLSQEPFSVQYLLCHRGAQLVRLPDLFDYLWANSSGSLVHQASARRWLEAADAIERVRDPDILQVQVLKTVSLLGILGDISHLSATPEVISLALADAPASPEVDAALDGLRARSLLVYRRFNGTFKVWEGSDVDIDACLEDARQKTAGQSSLADVLQRYLPHRPLVARRHSYETGALRFFDVRYVDQPVAPDKLVPEGGTDGLIACCLPSGPEHVQAFLDWATSTQVASLAHLIIVIPQQIGRLREAAAELRALQWVWENTPELLHDRIARRELAERRALTEQMISWLVDYLLDPRPEPVGTAARWLRNGQAQPVYTPADTVKLLSDVMDELYRHTPRMFNELINRRSLSSAAAKARRNLIELMLEHGNEPLLGMQGYPPERSMYESVLAATQLHRQEDGMWGFGPPPPDDPCGIRPTWDALHRLVFGVQLEPISVASIFQRLSMPPYGVMPGVLPVFLAAFALAYCDEISFYREGVFVPEPAVADFEVLMRRPELFAIGGARVQGTRAAVVQRLAAGLGVRPAALPVVRALVRRVRSLPETAWRTRRLPADTLALRQAFERARSPERLLFHDLPEALGEAPFKDSSLSDPERIERFFERLNAALSAWARFYPELLERARDDLLTACSLPAGEQGWQQLREQARALEAKVTNASLVPFVRRLTIASSEQAVLEGVLALVAERPPRSWTDADIERFPELAQSVGARFAEARHLAGILTAEEVARTAELAAQLRATCLQSGLPAQVVRAALAHLLQEW